MTPPLTSLYHKFYETYSKKYGENTCIFLLVGKFYELYASENNIGVASSVRRATSLMNIILKEKPAQGPKGEIGLWGGIPEQSLHKYAQVLTREGWTVVVVDQVKGGDQVIDRVPTRVLSPGTHIEMANQDRMTVSAIYCIRHIFACSVLDLTTGEVFSFQTTSPDDILHMLQVYSTRETIITSTQTPFTHSLATLKSMFGIHGILHEVPPITETSFQREEYLRKMFRLKSMLPVRSSLGILHEPSELSLCSLLRFIEDHFPEQAERLTSHEIYTPNEHMRLSNNILEQLSIITTNQQKSILSMLERTHSSIGKRALRERILRPITNQSELTLRWEQIDWAMNIKQKETCKILERDLKSLYDIPRLHYKLAGGSINTVDVLQMFQSYSATTCLIQNLRNTPLACSKELEDAIQEFRIQVRSLLDEEKALMREANTPIGFLTSISGPLTECVEVKIQEIQETWRVRWEKFCKDANLPKDSFYLQRDESEYSWEGPRQYLKAINGEIFAMSKKPQPILKGLEVEHKKAGPITLKSAEIYVFTDSLRTCVKELNMNLKREIVDVCDSLWESVHPFQNSWIEWLGNVDSTLALASVASELKWCRPSLGNSLHIEGLRHPLLESAQTRMEYVKHTVSLGSQETKGSQGSKGSKGPQEAKGSQGSNGWLIYGVNASGKSSLMKATGIAVILAQAGSFVPASSMSIRPYDAAFSRIWSNDNIWAGLSSFAVEISELRDILLSATSNSLVLGDEVCSGTESMSATSLVASTLEYLDSIGAHFMFATHLHDLMKVPGFLPRPGISVWHLRVQRTPEGKLIYDRTLQPGSGSCTYGLEVARAMGIPLTLLDRAHEIRKQLSGEYNPLKSSWNSEILRKSCEICGKSVVKELEVHHIHERAKGGDNSLRNLVVLCEECHDKHHSGTIDVSELRMTSEGLERLATPESVGTPESMKVNVKDSSRQKTKSWTDEEMETIRATMQKFQNRPSSRICIELEEKGIYITQAQLKKIVL